MERKNVLYISYNGWLTNFYGSIKSCPFSKIIIKNNIENLSLMSYDAYIICISIFTEEEIAKKLVDEIILLDKPVIIVYSERYIEEFSAFKYLSKKFGIRFEMKDCSILENSYDDYIPSDRGGYALSMLSKSGYGKSFIKNTQNCFIMRFSNVSVIHDVEPQYLGTKLENMQQISTTFLNLLEIPNSSEIPKWINDIKILDDEIIEEKITNIEKNINDLKVQKDKEVIKLSKNNEYKKVLYTTGEELVNAVKIIILEMLQIPINNVDIKKEDLSFVLGNKKILVEVKGVNTPIKREHISQIQRHIEDDAKENGIDDENIPDKYKGLLIINPYIKTSVNERIGKDFYSKIVQEDIKHYNICTLDTITLLSIFQKYRKNKQTIDFKEIILNNSYNEPDFSILN